MSVRLERKLFTILKYFIILLPLFWVSVTCLYDLAYLNSDTHDIQSLDEVIEYAAGDYIYQYGGPIVERLNNSLESIGTFKPFNDIYDKLSSLGIFEDSVSGYLVVNYLDYIVFVELIFLILYLFRFFIHFTINLFERKRDT